MAELTYGEDVNWYRNVVAAGGCDLLVGGVTHRVVAVEPYPVDAGRRAFGYPARLVLRPLRRKEFRLLAQLPVRAEPVATALRRASDVR